jgi:ferredoxin-NADP reductase
MYLFTLIILIVIFLFVATSAISMYQQCAQASKLRQRAEQKFQDRINDAVSHPQSEAKEAAWSGNRTFVVDRKKRECPSICSFYLVAEDQRPLPAFSPGQFLTVTLAVPGESDAIVRCYSLSDSWNKDYYRISVKGLPPPFSKPDAPPGIASNFLADCVHKGDTLKVQAPGGDFLFNAGRKQPVVLIAGGIGITPLLAMAKALAKERSEREVWFFYGVRNPAEQGFTPELLKLIEDLNNLHLRVCYSRPLDPEVTMSATEDPVKRIQAILLRSDSQETFNIKESGSTIGRDPDFVDIVLTDAGKASRQHARIYLEDDNWYVEDLNSHNGTLVNDKFVTGHKARLQNGDKIEFSKSADAECIFVLETVNQENPTSLDPEFIRMSEFPSSAEVVTKINTSVAVPMHLEKQFIIEKMITVDLLKQLLPSNNYKFYICGPPAMMQSITTGLAAWNVPASDINHELFGPASAESITPDEPAQPAKVIFAKSDRQETWTSGNLLNFAKDKQIPLRSGCRVGNCGECKVRIIEGEVTYPGGAPNAAHADDECLACVAQPRGDLTLDI